MDWNGWNAGKDRKGDQEVILTFTECHVQAVSERAIHVFSRVRKMRLAFPMKVPMRWTLQDGRVVANAGVRIGDELVSVSLPKWLREAKLQEIRDAAERRGCEGERAEGEGGRKLAPKPAKVTQPTLFQDAPAPHVCGNPCPRMACPECADLWREHEKVLARVAGMSKDEGPMDEGITNGEWGDSEGAA